MPKAYSLDLRKRVARFVGSGRSRHAAAAHFYLFQGNDGKDNRVRDFVRFRVERAKPQCPKEFLAVGFQIPCSAPSHREKFPARDSREIE